MRKLVLTLIVSTAFFTSKAQEVLTEYNWNNAPNIHELSDDDQDESYVIIKDKQAVEFYITSEGRPGQISLFHQIVHLNDDEAVDRFNKLSTPPAQYFNFAERQARVIKANGEVIYLDDEDILQEEGEQFAYEYFALEGIEVGDEVEWMYIYYTFPRFNSKKSFQASGIKKEVEFSVIIPSYLTILSKSYNGLPDMVLDSNYENEDLNYYNLVATDVPKELDEKNAATEANSYFLIYQLDENTYSNYQADPYSEFSKSRGEEFGEIDAKKAKVNKLVKEAGILETDDTETKIRKMENWMKDVVRYSYQGGEDDSDPKQVIKKKQGNGNGKINAMVAFFKYFDIDYQMVYTTNRMEAKFDPEFDSYMYLENVMIYFPSLDMYMSPLDVDSRLGLPDMTLVGHHGLFITMVDLDGTYSGFGKVRMIEPPAKDLSVDKFTVKASFPELPKTHIEFDRELSGYAGTYYQGYYQYNDEDDKLEMEEGLVNYIDEDMEIKELEVENLKPNQIMVEPVKVHAEVSSDKMVSKAGNNYLINVGTMIGPQAEMYNEGERKSPIDLYYLHSYDRTIVIEIPDGYEIANPEEVEMNFEFAPEGKDENDMGFVSTYKMEDGKMVISISEYYYSLNYPLDRYEDYLKVVNAAADFNKVNLLLKKS